MYTPGHQGTTRGHAPPDTVMRELPVSMRRPRDRGMTGIALRALYSAVPPALEIAPSTPPPPKMFQCLNAYAQPGSTSAYMISANPDQVGSAASHAVPLRLCLSAKRLSLCQARPL